MTRSPVVAFGLCATSTALNAKCGRIDLRGRLALAAATLQLMPRDEAVCAAVAGFLKTVEAHPISAGRALESFVLDWLDSIPMRTVPPPMLWQVQPLAFSMTGKSGRIYNELSRGPTHRRGQGHSHDGAG